jgi:hypothetical protein
MVATVAKTKKIGTAPSKTNLFGVKAPRPLCSLFVKRAIQDPVPDFDCRADRREKSWPVWGMKSYSGAGY